MEVLRKAFSQMGKTIPETDEEIDLFLERYNSGDTEAPETPAHLSPDALLQAIISEKLTYTPSDIIRFPAAHTADQGLDTLSIAARNGGEALSDETITKMRAAQKSDKP